MSEPPVEASDAGTNTNSSSTLGTAVVTGSLQPASGSALYTTMGYGSMAAGQGQQLRPPASAVVPAAEPTYESRTGLVPALSGYAVSADQPVPLSSVGQILQQNWPQRPPTSYDSAIALLLHGHGLSDADIASIIADRAATDAAAASFIMEFSAAARTLEAAVNATR